MLRGMVGSGGMTQGSADEASLYRRRVVVEIKHGRVCMVAFLGMTVGPNETVRCQSFVNM